MIKRIKAYFAHPMTFGGYWLQTYRDTFHDFFSRWG